MIRMTYAEFYELAGQYAEAENTSDYLVDSVEDCFIIHWYGPGRSGGNCWGGEATDYPGDPEPPLQSMDSFLTAIGIPLEGLCPPTTQDSHSPDEWYGNVTLILEKRIKFKALWDYLIQGKHLVEVK